VAWVQPLIGMLSGIQDMMSAITFIQFIEEEAIQTAALGTFLALRTGSMKGAALGINQMRVVVDHLDLINGTLGYAAPYSRGCFQDFVAASRTNILIYEGLLYERVQKAK
jgi:hypothetical protein